MAERDLHSPYTGNICKCRACRLLGIEKLSKNIGKSAGPRLVYSKPADNNRIRSLPPWRRDVRFFRRYRHQELTAVVYQRPPAYAPEKSPRDYTTAATGLRRWLLRLP